MSRYRGYRYTTRGSPEDDYTRRGYDTYTTRGSSEDDYTRRGYDSYTTGRSYYTGDTEYSYTDYSGSDYSDTAYTADRRYLRGDNPTERKKRGGVGRVERYHVDRRDGRRWAVEVYKDRADYQAAQVGGVTCPHSASTKSWLTHSTDDGFVDHGTGDNKPWWLWEEPPVPESNEPIRFPWDYPVEEDIWEDMHWRSGAVYNSWQDCPMQAPLLRPSSAEIGTLGVQMFCDVLRFMGDQPLPQDYSRSHIALKILDTVHDHPELADELYCQLCKQTTKNDSPNPDSCRLGWRLMALVTCFFPCSDTLKPYLTKYFVVNANNPDRSNAGVALACRKNLERTLECGGRKTQPSTQELEAHTIGRTNKRQTIALPNNTRRTVNISASSLVEDCVSQLCYELGITDPIEAEEYSLHCVIEEAGEYSIITPDEYIFDILSELDSGGVPYFLLFQRNSWRVPLRFGNTDCNDIHFNQLSRDYMDGLYLIIREAGFPDKQMEDVAMLGALLHVIRDEGRDTRPTSRNLAHVIPNTLRIHLDYDAKRWLQIIQNKVYGLGQLSVAACKVRFLEIISNWFLFGATFSSADNVSEAAVRSPCLIAINKRGVLFLNRETREIYLVVEFKDIESARRYTAEGRGYLDIRRSRGQPAIRIQTDNGNDLALLIGQYITVGDAVRG